MGLMLLGLRSAAYLRQAFPGPRSLTQSLHGKFVVDAIVIAIINYLLAMAIASEFAERCNEKVNKGQGKGLYNRGGGVLSWL